MIRVMAIYENGILKPFEPLSFAEGQAVELSVSVLQPITPLRPPTTEEAEFAVRVKAAVSLKELFAIIDTAPTESTGYDLFHALDENRKSTGERLLYPELHNGENP